MARFIFDADKIEDIFKIPAYEKSKYEFDGHTSQDVLERLKSVI